MSIDDIALQPARPFRSGVNMENIDVRDCPELEHKVLRSRTNNGFVQPVPESKTQKEIDDMWEYNKITGRGYLPKGIK